MPDASFVFAQSLSGLTAAMFLFLIASGLSLIFGVLRVLNFAHGTFYMLGAYLAYQAMLWLGPGPGLFWLAALGAALGIALRGGVVERVLFRHLYEKEELYQLLFTYALGLILSDAAKIVCTFAVDGLTRTVPSSGWTRPARSWSSVDLPAPFTPTSPTTSPGATTRSRPVNSTRSP